MDVLSDPQFTAEFWGWANRIAAVASIVGAAAGVAGLIVAVAIGLPQLRHIREEQRRIANEQERRADLLVGFPAADPDEPIPVARAKIEAVWEPDRDFSWPLVLMIRTYNAGTRSARDLFWTFIFEGIPEHVTSSFGERMYPALQPISDGGANDETNLRIVPDQPGTVRMVSRLSYLHPGTSQSHGFKIYLSRGMQHVEVIVLLSSADADYQHVELVADVVATNP
jgi:hypothetical protein